MNESFELIQFFEWCEDTFIGEAVISSIWAFPVIEAFHLLALCILGGAVLVDLRMLGLGMTGQRTEALAGHARKWLIAAIVLMFATGIPLFLSEAVKCYYNTSFWVKMTTLPFALLFTFKVREKVAQNPELEATIKSKMAGFANIALWFTVAAAGRWIGFS